MTRFEQQPLRYVSASVFQKVDNAIPQGSILGPVLFTVYINDLLAVSKHCQSACYVDDSKLFLKFKTSELYNAVSAVNSDLNRICMWCCHNSLFLNPDKTKLLVVGVPQLLRQLPDFTITLCGKPISPIPVAKDLGVILTTLTRDFNVKIVY